MADTPEIISIAARIAEIAAEKPQAPALSFEGETFTWDQFHRRTNRIAHALAARGVRQGDFVTIGLPNSAGFIEACVGAWKIGATPQPVSHRLPLHELEAIVELAQPALVIARPGMDAPRPRRRTAC
jgi:bile acid-coenzyme A ligase